MVSVIMKDQAEWVLKNKRRGLLIKKQRSEGLIPPEARELRQLQTETARHLDQVAPISFEALEELEAIARRITPVTDVSHASERRST
jgi:hypothetical protein